MDFDLRQWLLILGPIFVVAVLLHGYLRMRASNNQIGMKLDRSFLTETGEEADLDDLGLLKAELPNGGARVILKDEESSEAAVETAAVELPASEDLPAADEVPMLVESVELPSIRATDDPAEMQAELPKVSAAPEKPAAQVKEKPTPPAKKTAIKAPPATVADVAVASASKPVETSETPETPAPGREEPTEPQVTSATGEAQSAVPEPEPPRKVRRAAALKETAKATPRPEKFVVVSVLAREEPFPGQRLLEIFLDAGMMFGEMDIFHRMQDESTPAFSLASAVEPGTFDPATMNAFSTPGVSLFLRVHELSEPLATLDEMLAVADRIALELDGEVRDETRSVMTPQTVEHLKQSIREFQFKHSA